MSVGLVGLNLIEVSKWTTFQAEISRLICSRLNTFYPVGSTAAAVARCISRVLESHHKRVKISEINAFISRSTSYRRLWRREAKKYRLRFLSRNFPRPPQKRKPCIDRQLLSCNIINYLFQCQILKESVPFPRTYGFYVGYYVSLSIRAFCFISVILLFCFLFQRLQIKHSVLLSVYETDLVIFCVWCEFSKHLLMVLPNEKWMLSIH